MLLPPELVKRFCYTYPRAIVGDKFRGQVEDTDGVIEKWAWSNPAQEVRGYFHVMPVGDSRNKEDLLAAIAQLEGGLVPATVYELAVFAFGGNWFETRSLFACGSDVTITPLRSRTSPPDYNPYQEFPYFTGFEGGLLTTAGPYDLRNNAALLVRPTQSVAP